jgi:hypothetical protein
MSQSFQMHNGSGMDIPIKFSVWPRIIISLRMCWLTRYLHFFFCGCGCFSRYFVGRYSLFSLLILGAAIPAEKELCCEFWRQRSSQGKCGPGWKGTLFLHNILAYTPDFCPTDSALLQRKQRKVDDLFCGSWYFPSCLH